MSSKNIVKLKVASVRRADDSLWRIGLALIVQDRKQGTRLEADGGNLFLLVNDQNIFRIGQEWILPLTMAASTEATAIEPPPAVEAPTAPPAPPAEPVARRSNKGLAVPAGKSILE